MRKGKEGATIDIDRKPAVRVRTDNGGHVTYISLVHLLPIFPERALLVPQWQSGKPQSRARGAQGRMLLFSIPG